MLHFTQATNDVFSYGREAANCFAERRYFSGNWYSDPIIPRFVSLTVDKLIVPERKNGFNRGGSPGRSPACNHGN